MTADDQRFPDGFRWGTATAAHQIEGGNWNNDWWRFEHAPGSGCAEVSGDACDSFHRWPEDADLVAELGFDNYRFSVEWSRIEPEDGEWSQAASDHYRRVCEGLRERGVDPVVTFHHFTSPRWLADQGGWANPETADRFGAFCEKVAGALGDVMARACTINEPNMVGFFGYQIGAFPPGDAGPQSSDGYRRAIEVLVTGHRNAVEAIRANAPGVPVGITLAMQDWEAIEGGESRRDHYRQRMEDVFLDATAGDDFLGVQTYSRARVGPEGLVDNEEGVPVLPMGYEFWPQSLEATLRRAWDYTGGSVPLWVTENGIGTDDDGQRLDYVQQALQGLLRAIADGVDVGGYTYWSLLDNFEWAYGYRPKFGLVGVDHTTFARTVKPSARWLGRVAQANAFTEPTA